MNKKILYLVRQFKQDAYCSQCYPTQCAIVNECAEYAIEEAYREALEAKDKEHKKMLKEIVGEKYSEEGTPFEWSNGFNFKRQKIIDIINKYEKS